MENKNGLAAKGIVIIAVVVIAVLATVAIMSHKPEEKMISVPLETSTVTSDAFKDGYMDGCVSDTATYAFCSCSYDSMLNRMGKEKLINMSLDYLKTEQIPESVLNNIITDCASKM